MFTAHTDPLVHFWSLDFITGHVCNISLLLNQLVLCNLGSSCPTLCRVACESAWRGPQNFSSTGESRLFLGFSTWNQLRLGSEPNPVQSSLYAGHVLCTGTHHSWGAQSCAMGRIASRAQMVRIRDHQGSPRGKSVWRVICLSDGTMIQPKLGHGCVPHRIMPSAKYYWAFNFILFPLATINTYRKTKCNRNDRAGWCKTWLPCTESHVNNTSVCNSSLLKRKF